MLTSQFTERREIPHETDQWMVFKLLSWKALDDARTARQIGALRSLSGVADVVRELQTARTNGEVVAAESDPTNDYDRSSLLKAGIKAWSYDAPVTPENIADLDEATAEWAAKEIVHMHVRTQTEREAGFFRTRSGTE